MKWIEFSIHTSNEAIEPVANLLHEHGAQGVVIDDPLELVKEREDVFGEIYQLSADDYPDEGAVLKGYFAVDDFSKELRADVEAAVLGLQQFAIDIGKNLTEVREVDEDDWASAWKQYYHPIKVSEQITIVPTWEEYAPKSAGEKLIWLDPGMAFGTGTHSTTTLCIQALEKWVKPGQVVVDVGTGSGVLSITAALFGASRVIALDLDSVAVKVAEENCQVNKVADVVTVSQNDLLQGMKTTADVIVANILADVIIKITNDVYQSLVPNGIFIASGIISEKQEQVVAAMVEAGLTIVEIAEENDWVAITATRSPR